MVALRAFSLQIKRLQKKKKAKSTLYQSKCSLDTVSQAFIFHFVVFADRGERRRKRKLQAEKLTPSGNGLIYS